MPNGVVASQSRLRFPMQHNDTAFCKHVLTAQLSYRPAIAVVLGSYSAQKLHQLGGSLHMLQAPSTPYMTDDACRAVSCEP